LEIVKFLSNRDLMRGLKLLLGKHFIGIIDGTTYFTSSEGVNLLDSEKVNYLKINDKKNKELVEKFKEEINGGF